jgi:hypothetical protein
MYWLPFDNGATIGRRGSEGGAILRELEHPDGARIALERGGAVSPFAITCGIYGWMVHTSHYSTLREAEIDYEKMKEDLSRILSLMPRKGDPNAREEMPRVVDEISTFTEHYR